MRQRLIHASQVAVLLFSLAVIVFMVRGEWGEVVSYLGRTDIFLLVLGTLLVPVQMIGKRYAWTTTIRRLGEDVDLLSGLSLASLFQVGSYVPGGFWHFIGISYWGEEHGLAKKTTAAGSVANALINLEVGMLVFAAFGVLSIGKLGVFSYLVVAVMVVGLGVFLHPQVYGRLVDYLLEWYGAPPLEQRLEVGDLVTVAGIQLVSRLVEGVSVFLIIGSVYPLPVSALVPVTAIVAGSWAVGFLVFFMPSGLGARDASFVYLVSFLAPASVAVLAAAYSRLVYVLVEVLLAAVFLQLTRERGVRYLYRRLRRSS